MMISDGYNGTQSTVASVEDNDEYEGATSFSDYRGTYGRTACYATADFDVLYRYVQTPEPNFHPHSFLRERYNNLIRVLLKQIFPVRSFLYHRQMLFPKSGFLGRAGKRRKN